VEDELALLERWRTGDTTAGRDLFRRYFADVHRFFEHKVGGEADDLAQRTFAACVAARDRFRAQSSFRTYLFAIARNELYTYLRRLPRGEHVDFEDTSIAALVTTMGSRIDRAREAEVLRAILRDLPAEQQLLLELHYWHDLDAPALAEVFEVPTGTIRVRLLRARRSLRERLEGLEPRAFASLASDGLVASVTRPEAEAE